MSVSGGPQRLVIIGASYAGEWEQPALPGYTVSNKGVGGEDSRQVRARFERDVLAQKPDAVIIWGYINNIHRAPAGGMDSAVAKVQEDYVDMVSRGEANGIKVILATEVTLSEAVGFGNRIAALLSRLQGKQGYNAGVNAQVRRLNEWLKGYARQRGLQVLDFEKVLDDGRGFREVEYSSDDGTHISREGYAALTAYAQSQMR